MSEKIQITEEIQFPTAAAARAGAAEFRENPNVLSIDHLGAGKLLRVTGLVDEEEYAAHVAEALEGHGIPEAVGELVVEPGVVEPGVVEPVAPDMPPVNLDTAGVAPEATEQTTEVATEEATETTEAVTLEDGDVLTSAENSAE